MKEGSLFCVVSKRSTEPGPGPGYASDPVLGVLGKLSMMPLHGLGSMAFGLAVQKLLNIE
jgi:hypothetical protein